VSQLLCSSNTYLLGNTNVNIKMNQNSLDRTLQGATLSDGTGARALPGVVFMAKDIKR